MNVSQAEFQNMKEEIVKDLIARLMDERDFTSAISRCSRPSMPSTPRASS